MTTDHVLRGTIQLNIKRRNEKSSERLFLWIVWIQGYNNSFVFVYEIKCYWSCPFDYTAVAGSGKVGLVNQVNHTSWVAVVTPTDRPKSVRNRCLIELFCGVVCVFTLPFWHFLGCRVFCHTTESDLLLFVLNAEKRFVLQSMTFFS